VVDHKPSDGGSARTMQHLVVVGHGELRERIRGLNRLTLHPHADQLLLRFFGLFRVGAGEVRRERLSRGQEVHLRSTRVATPAEVSKHLNASAGMQSFPSGLLSSFQIYV